jgi:uncharacterized RDD family membrane protein YckC
VAPEHDAADPGASRGRRIGLPAEGPGSPAPLLARVGAFAVDAIASALVAALFTAPALPKNWSLLAFFCEYVFFTAIFGQTPGMRLTRVGVVRADGSGRVGLGRTVVRTVLLMLVVPALIWDADRRGLHDRVTDTVTVRAD